MIVLILKVTPSVCQGCKTYECAIQNVERLMKSNANDKYDKIFSNLNDAEDFAGNDETKKKKIRDLRKQALIAIQNEKKKADEATNRAEIEAENARKEKQRADSKTNEAIKQARQAKSEYLSKKALDEFQKNDREQDATLALRLAYSALQLDSSESNRKTFNDILFEGRNFKKMRREGNILGYSPDKKYCWSYNEQTDSMFIFDLSKASSDTLVLKTSLKGYIYRYSKDSLRFWVQKANNDQISSTKEVLLDWQGRTYKTIEEGRIIAFNTDSTHYIVRNGDLAEMLDWEGHVLFSHKGEWSLAGEKQIEKSNAKFLTVFFGYRDMNNIDSTFLIDWNGKVRDKVGGLLKYIKKDYSLYEVHQAESISIKGLNDKIYANIEGELNDNNNDTTCFVIQNNIKNTTTLVNTKSEKTFEFKGKVIGFNKVNHIIIQDDSTQKVQLLDFDGKEYGFINGIHYLGNYDGMTNLDTKTEILFYDKNRDSSSILNWYSSNNPKIGTIEGLIDSSSLYSKFLVSHAKNNTITILREWENKELLTFKGKEMSVDGILTERDLSYPYFIEHQKGKNKTKLTDWKTGQSFTLNGYVVHSNIDYTRFLSQDSIRNITLVLDRKGKEYGAMKGFFEFYKNGMFGMVSIEASEIKFLNGKGQIIKSYKGVINHMNEDFSHILIYYGKEERGYGNTFKETRIDLETPVYRLVDLRGSVLTSFDAKFFGNFETNSSIPNFTNNLKSEFQLNTNANYAHSDKKQHFWIIEQKTQKDVDTPPEIISRLIDWNGQEIIHARGNEEEDPFIFKNDSTRLLAYNSFWDSLQIIDNKGKEIKNIKGNIRAFNKDSSLFLVSSEKGDGNNWFYIVDWNGIVHKRIEGKKFLHTNEDRTRLWIEDYRGSRKTIFDWSGTKLKEVWGTFLFFTRKTIPDFVIENGMGYYLCNWNGDTTKLKDEGDTEMKQLNNTLVSKNENNIIEIVDSPNKYSSIYMTVDLTNKTFHSVDMSDFKGSKTLIRDSIYLQNNNTWGLDKVLYNEKSKEKLTFKSGYTILDFNKGFNKFLVLDIDSFKIINKSSEVKYSFDKKDISDNNPYYCSNPDFTRFLFTSENNIEIIDVERKKLIPISGEFGGFNKDSSLFYIKKYEFMYFYNWSGQLVGIYRGELSSLTKDPKQINIEVSFHKNDIFIEDLSFIATRHLYNNIDDFMKYEIDGFTSEELEGYGLNEYQNKTIKSTFLFPKTQTIINNENKKTERKEENTDISNSSNDVNHITTDITGEPEPKDFIDITGGPKPKHFYEVSYEDSLRNLIKIEEDTIKIALLYSKLVDTLEKQYEQTPNVKSSLLEAYVDWAEYAFELKQFGRAEKLALKGLNLEEKDKTLTIILADALLFQGKYDEAAKIYLAEDFSQKFERRKSEIDPNTYVTLAKEIEGNIIDHIFSIQRKGYKHPDLQKILKKAKDKGLKPLLEPSGMDNFNNFEDEQDIKNRNTVNNLTKFELYQLKISELIKKDTADLMVRQKLAKAYNGLAWQALLLKKITDAENAVNDGFGMDKDQTLLKKNFGHILLLQNKYNDALRVYKEYADFSKNDFPTGLNKILNDLNDLEAVDVIDKDIAKIKNELKK